METTIYTVITEGGGRTYTNNSLANHDTDDFEVCHGGNPVVRAGSGFLAPAIRPDSFEERLEVTNGEEDITLQTKTGSRNDSMAEIPRERRKRVLLEHGPSSLGLLLGSIVVDL
jgi:hypothetical protein